MTSAISVEKIQIKSNLDLQQLLAFEMHVVRGKHACINLKAAIREESQLAIYFNCFGEKITVTLLDENGAEQTPPLFCGYISNMEMGYDGGYAIVYLAAKSPSWMLDTQKISRSFQNPGYTYASILDMVAENTKGSDFIIAAPDKPIEKPIIQYQETDWEFALRIASHLHTTLLPDVTSFSPRLFVGLTGEKQAGKIDSPDYNFGIDDRYFEFGHTEFGYTKNQLAYYDVPAYKSYQIGEAVTFNSKQYVICEKHARLEKDILLFTYRIAKKEYMCSRMLHNPRIRGVSLCGTVTATREEHLTVQLDIDSGWAATDTYWYSWMPETGNMMYLMPQIGTRVRLYIPTHNEKSAICVECVRENGEVHPEMANTADRYLTTEHGMRMRLLPDDMAFLSFNSGNKFEMLDTFGNMYESSKKLNIKAKDKVTIKGSRVLLTAPKEMTVVCRRWDMPSVINLCNNFDLIGKKSKFDTDIPPQQDTLQKMIKTENIQNASYSVAGIEQQILAAVPFSTGGDASIAAAVGTNVFFNTRQ